MSWVWVPIFDSRNQLTGRVGMSTISEYNIQCDDTGLGIGSLLLESPQPKVLVDHRMRATDGELIGPEIENRVARAHPSVG